MASARVTWEDSVSGTTLHCATGERDVFIIAPGDSCPDSYSGGSDAVPRRKVSLTEEDKTRLTNQGVAEEYQQGDLSIMKARFANDRQCHVTDELSYETASSLVELTKGNVLRRIEIFLKVSLKPRVYIYYIGAGKRNTGDWCFKDGFITFRELAQIYLSSKFRGRCLGIISDCSHAGAWVQSCMSWLDEEGVRPCGHSAHEKDILVKVFASSRPSEVPGTFQFSARGCSSDKNTQAISFAVNSSYKGEELYDKQHAYGIDFTHLRCRQKDIEKLCILRPGSTWNKWSAYSRVYLVRGKDQGRAAWHYVLLVDDEETIRIFTEKIERSDNLDVADYGQVLRSGWGGDPPQDVREWIENEYTSYG